MAARSGMQRTLADDERCSDRHGHSKKPRVDAGDSKAAPLELALSGKLAAHSLTAASGTVVRYQQPPDAAPPTLRYRLYAFSLQRSEASPSTLHLHREAMFAIGRDSAVNDLVLSHPSVSKQHAVIQFRRTARSNAGGGPVPYLMDVGSVNGTWLNGARVEPARYYELREKDVLRFAQNDKEYVLMHEASEAGATDTQQGTQPADGEDPAAPRRNPAEADKARSAVTRGSSAPAASGGGSGRQKRRPVWAEDDDDW